ELAAHGLAAAAHRVHAADAHAPDRLDSATDVGLGRLGRDDKGVLAAFGLGVGLLAHDRRDDDVAWLGGHDAFAFVRRAWTLSSAAFTKITLSALRRSYTLS